MIDEIAMNPDFFMEKDFTPKSVMSTLVHEMCHLYQKYFGKPGRGRYHNKEWADIMLGIGLMPTDDGSQKGKQTGDRMDHIILPGKPFDLACNELLGQIKIAWFDKWAAQVLAEKADEDGESAGAESEKVKKRRSKSKYVCPKCGMNVWGKPDLCVICGRCKVELVLNEASEVNQNE